MKHIHLIHWNAAEASRRAERLRAAGYPVIHGIPAGPELLRELRNQPPLAIVIDLTRLPSHGREVALALRQFRATRHVPLVFTEGEPGKVERIKRLLPDATYTSWTRIRSALKRAIAHPPANPVVPESVMAGYSGTPLPRKLGIKPNSVVALIGAPPDFPETLGDLPEGAQLRDGAGPCDLSIWFMRSARDLAGLPTARGPLWIAWPKKASGIVTDLSEPVVRQAGLAAGLVDYKVCAIDATWSGLLFATRKK